jgi:cytoskeleton protein RodZ
MQDMSTVAEQLRRAREARNLTVQGVAEITKIRTDHIRALEEGNFDIFSAPVYIRGFVRTYSTLLKLNVAEVMSELDLELGQTHKFAEPPPLSGNRGTLVDKLMLQLSKVDWQKAAIVLAVLVVLAAIAVAVVLVRKPAKPEAAPRVKPALYQPKKGSGDTLPLPGNK